MRKLLHIAGSDGAGTGYQVLLRVGESDGAYGYDFHLNNNSLNFPSKRNDGGDLKFTDEDDNLLNFWVESISGTSPNRVARIWVKVDNDLSSSQNIYIYYHLNNTPNYSDGKSTFELFDDFENLTYTDQWTKDGSGDITKGIYVKFHAGNGGQGLTTDGTYFYFGKSNGAGVSGTIYKYDFSGNLQTSFDGPPHAAGGSYRIDNDTIVFSSGGTDTPEVVELSKTGTQIQAWDFTGEGYNRGALVAYKDIDRIYLFTSDTSSNFKIQEYQINDDGTWNTVGIEYSHTSIGVPQGACYVNGYLYYLYDNGISKLQFNANGSITILETLSNLPGSEKEGLTCWDNTFYYGDSNKDIRIIYNEFLVHIGSYSTYLTSNNTYGYNTALRVHCRATSTTLDYPMWGYRSADNKDNAVIGKLHIANNYLQTRTKKDGTLIESGNISSTQSTWAIYDIKRSNDRVKYYINNKLKHIETSNVPTSNMPIKLGGTTHGESGDSRFNWVVVRKYISPEPKFTPTNVVFFSSNF